MAVKTYSLSLVVEDYVESDVSLASVFLLTASCLLPPLGYYSATSTPSWTAIQLEAELITGLDLITGSTYTLSTTLIGTTLTITIEMDADDAICFPTALTVYTTPDGSTSDAYNSAPFITESDCPPVPVEPPTQCAECYKTLLPACQDAYAFTAGLTPDTDYVVVVTDLFGKQYTQSITSDGVGDFVIDATATGWPSGLFTPESSPVQIEVKVSADDQDSVAITVNNVEYPCITANYTYRTDTAIILFNMFIMQDFGETLTDDSGEGVTYD